MGDVFDAMNRAKKEKEKQAGAVDARPVADESGDAAPRQFEEAEKPAGDLPIHEIDVEPMAVEDARKEAATRPPATPPPSSKPIEKRSKRNNSDAALPVKSNDSLNGYSREVIVHHDRGSIITEQYRAIRTQILARARTRRLQTHVVTSSAPEEGKSVTTINLGMAFAELRNQRTLVVEGDLRRPSFMKLFDRSAKPGLLQLLRNEAEIDDVLQHTVYDNFQFIDAGGRESMQSTELLSSPRMAQVLDRLKDRYDHIFIDSPPVITVTDPCILGAMADEVLLVVRLNRTPTEIVDRAKRLLRAANCELSGVILTHMAQELSDYKYRYSYYYYGRGRK